MLHIHKIHIHVQGKQLGTVLRGNYGLFIKKKNHELQDMLQYSG